MNDKMYRVYRTNFHGGGLLSRHRTRAAADKAAQRRASSECTCGCVVVIEPGMADPEPAGEGSAYRAAS